MSEVPAANKIACSPQQLTPITTAARISDPFQQLAEQPWQQLDLDSPRASQRSGTQPEVTPESALSIANMDDSVVTSSDPAASDFLLAALMFQEQRSVTKQQSLNRDTLQDKLADLTVCTESCNSSATKEGVYPSAAY